MMPQYVCEIQMNNCHCAGVLLETSKSVRSDRSNATIISRFLLQTCDVKNSKRMDDETIFLPFDAQNGEIVNARSLFVDAGCVGEDYQSSKMSNILQRVQSKAGTIVQGYDEGDGFVDDSEVQTHESHSLEIESFRVALTATDLSNSSKVVSKSVSKAEESVGETEVTSDELKAIQDRIKLASATMLLGPQSEGSQKKQPNINLNNEILELISQYVDERNRLLTEQASSKNLGKRKLDIWKRDSLQLIQSSCFTAYGNQFITLRRLQVLYTKYKKEENKDQGDGEEDHLKKVPPPLVENSG
jgi:hypothetical protein